MITKLVIDPLILTIGLSQLVVGQPSNSMNIYKSPTLLSPIESNEQLIQRQHEEIIIPLLMKSKDCDSNSMAE